MKWFINLKISAKLLLSFMIIALIAGGVGLYGIISLSSVNTSSQSLFEEHGNSQGDLGYVYGIYEEQRSMNRDIVIDKDIAAAKKIQQKAAESDKELTNYLDAYGHTCITQEDRAFHANLVEKIEDFRNVRDEIISLGVAGDFEAAHKLLEADNSANIITEATAAINEAVAANVEMAEIMMEQENDVVNNTILIMIILVAIAVILAVALGIIISRIISKPIRQISDAANLLADGDTNVKNTNYQSKDEIGQLTNSFKNILSAIKALAEDANMLTQAAVQGKLSTRADASRHKGDYQKIVEGVNNTLDAVIEPVNEAAAVLKEMAKGNLKSNVTGDYKGDHAVIKDALNDSVNTIKGYIDEISGVLAEVASGNLDVGIASEYRGDFVALKDSINNIAVSLNEVMTNINTAADQVASGTAQVSDGSQEISQGATEQASSIEELTASVTQISEQTRQNAENANKANEFSIVAKNSAVSGNEQMKNMQNAMREINESSENISKIIKVIDDIAFQTNILALNAAVEAARAGIHGKGFAVVAEEVRNLAARSAKAANETTNLIEGSTKKAEAGTRIADETAKALESIVDGVEKTVSSVSEIASASNEQATGIAEVNKGIEQLSQVVQTNSATAEEAAAASEELSSQAALLKNMVGKFKLSSDKKLNFAAAKTNNLPAAEQDMASYNSKEVQIKLNDDEFGKY